MNINFSEKCIVIDSGHGGADPGKVGVAGTNEKEINLAIAKKLQERLEDAQINVVFPAHLHFLCCLCHWPLMAEVHWLSCRQQQVVLLT